MSSTGRQMDISTPSLKVEDDHDPPSLLHRLARVGNDHEPASASDSNSDAFRIMCHRIPPYRNTAYNLRPSATQLLSKVLSTSFQNFVAFHKTCLLVP